MNKLVIMIVAIFMLPFFLPEVTYQKCYADEISIAFSPISYHIERPKKSNNINEYPHGIGVSYNGWSVITFENTSFNQSWFLGKQFKWKKWNNNTLFWGVNFYLGVLKGYDFEINVGGWTPILTPTFEIGKNHYSLETTYMPTENGGVIAAMIKYTF